MTIYILKRLLLFIPTLLAVMVITFFMLRVIPGDIVEIKLRGEGGLVTADMIKRERVRLGLDRPLATQFFEWSFNTARGDFGISMWTGKPVSEEIAARLPPTIELAMLGTVLGLVIAIPLGVVSALFRGRSIDNLIRLLTTAGMAIPPFWLAMLVILFLLAVADWVPSIIFVPIHIDPVTNLTQMIFPALVIAVRYAAVAARMMRASLLDTLGEDFVRTARAKGVVERLVIWRHALPNALLPVVTVVALEFAFLIGGVVITEQVFNINGVGRLFLQSIQHNDFIVVQAIVLLLAVTFMLVNLVADVLYAVFDPRIQYS